MEECTIIRKKFCPSSATSKLEKTNRKKKEGFTLPVIAICIVILQNFGMITSRISVVSR